MTTATLDMTMAATAARATPEIEAEIIFRNMEPSEAVAGRVRERVRWLLKFAKRVTAARVRIEAPHRNHAKGKIYHVRLSFALPGQPDLVVSHEPETDHAHEDIYIAIRDAFDAARRQLVEAPAARKPRVKAARVVE
jgi:ribosome-associated translation inhibitor RaiA